MMHWGYFHPFGFFFFILLIGLLIANIVTWKRRHHFGYRGYNDAHSILERRLASGEIDTDEYKRLKETLKY